MDYDGSQIFEIVLGDVMHYFPYSLDGALNLGFFEIHRLWSLQDELKARDLQYQSIAMELPHANEERRSLVWDWFKKRQPRTSLSQDMAQLSPEDRRRLDQLFREAQATRG